MATWKDRLQVVTKAAVGLFSDSHFQQAGEMIVQMLGAGGAPPVRGSHAYLRGYASMPWIRAIAGKIAYAVAATPWHLYTVKRPQDLRARRDRAIQYGSRDQRKALLQIRRKQHELIDVEEHPLLELLTDANTFHTGLNLRKLSMLYLDLVGDCFWLKQRNAVGAPVAAWPIPPHWVTKVPTADDPFYEIKSNGLLFRIQDSEMLWMSDSNPDNPYGRGIGHMQAVGDELETDEYAALMAKQVFFNRARPDLLVMPKEGTMEKEDVERLERGWTQATQGFWRAFRPFFIKRAVEVKIFEQNFQNVQLIELRQHQRDIVMQVFGIPPEILGVLENSNRATIEGAEYLFMEYVVVPRLELIRTHIQSRLIPEYDERLILEYDAPSRNDKRLELDAAKTAPWALNVDEWRAKIGLPEKEDGTGGLHMVPANLFATPSLLDATMEEEDDDEEEVPPAPAEEEARSFKALSTQELLTMRSLVKKIGAPR